MNKVTIILTQDVETLIKGQEITINKATAFEMVNVEKVAKFKEAEKKVEKKPKSE